MLSLQKNLPAWVLPSVIAGAFVVLVFLGWKVMNGGKEAPGPSIPVHAGMYDLRAEAQKAMTAHSGSHQ